jgi:hypothetical protein
MILGPLAGGSEEGGLEGFWSTLGWVLHGTFSPFIVGQVLTDERDHDAPVRGSRNDRTGLSDHRLDHRGRVASPSAPLRSSRQRRGPTRTTTSRRSPTSAHEDNDHATLADVRLDLRDDAARTSPGDILGSHLAPISREVTPSATGSSGLPRLAPA